MGERGVGILRILGLRFRALGFRALRSMGSRAVGLEFEGLGLRVPFWRQGFGSGPCCHCDVYFAT